MLTELTRMLLVFFKIHGNFYDSLINFNIKAHKGPKSHNDP